MLLLDSNFETSTFSLIAAVCASVRRAHPRMSIRTSFRHRGLVRVGAVALATLASVVLLAPASAAAPAVTIPLDPDRIKLNA